MPGHKSKFLSFFEIVDKIYVSHKKADLSKVKKGYKNLDKKNKGKVNQQFIDKVKGRTGILV
jgi:hypothetical protein